MQVLVNIVDIIFYDLLFYKLIEVISYYIKDKELFINSLVILIYKIVYFGKFYDLVIQFIEWVLKLSFDYVELVYCLLIFY